MNVENAAERNAEICEIFFRRGGNALEIYHRQSLTCLEYFSSYLLEAMNV
jgi:hypothetical protein